MVVYTRIRVPSFALDVVLVCIMHAMQALSNSIWALAHLKGRGMDLETTMGNALLRFLEALAQAAGSMLASLNHHRADLRTSHACKTFLQNAESNFSCQVRVPLAGRQVVACGWRRT
jgi:hypothetical protein